MTQVTLSRLRAHAWHPVRKRSITQPAGGGEIDGPVMTSEDCMGGITERPAVCAELQQLLLSSFSLSLFPSLFSSFVYPSFSLPSPSLSIIIIPSSILCSPLSSSSPLPISIPYSKPLSILSLPLLSIFCLSSLPLSTPPLSPSLLLLSPPPPLIQSFLLTSV